MLLYGAYGNKFNWFILLNIYLLPNSTLFVRNSLYNSSWMFIYDIVISELMRLKTGVFYFFFPFFRIDEECLAFYVFLINHTL